MQMVSARHRFCLLPYFKTRTSDPATLDALSSIVAYTYTYVTLLVTCKGILLDKTYPRSDGK